LLEKKPKRLSVIITGRNADKKLIDKADTVTVMDSQKHAFEQGIKAQKGLEY
jgi:cob(I)alamin adenosyltransferase